MHRDVHGLVTNLCFGKQNFNISLNKKWRDIAYA